MAHAQRPSAHRRRRRPVAGRREHTDMKRAAVLVPTSGGPIEGIVHEPDGPPVACAVALHGATGRSGTNRQGAHLADALADMGILVLRFDYLQAEDGSMARTVEQHEVALEAIDWFRQR